MTLTLTLNLNLSRTRLVAPQCRLLRALPAVHGALVAVTVPRRSFISSEQQTDSVDHDRSHDGAVGPAFKRLNLSNHRKIKRLDLSDHHKIHRQQKREEKRRHTAVDGRKQKRLLHLSYFLSPKLQDSDLAPANSATIIPASVTAATPLDFLDKIQPIDEITILAKQNLVVFLVTPSFAPWLLDESIFLEKALAKLYANHPGLLDSTSRAKVHARCAVVDRLPEPRPTGGDASAQDIRHRAHDPPVTDTGYEGIAYVVLPSTATVSKQPDIEGEFGCLEFLAHTHTDASGRHYDRLRVPLANTVFQTGQPTTLTRTVWTWSEDAGKLEMQKKWHLKTSVLNLSAEDSMSATQCPAQSHLHREAPALSIPLLPLTLPRQVDGYMGNIIRGLVGPNDAYMTASTELEHVVPQFFKARGEPAQATSAWALVIPKDTVDVVIKDTKRLISDNISADPADLTSKDYKLWEQKAFESLWQAQPPHWNTMIQGALTRGARLHKVLSGGGGWGKKAGLLSLNPVPVGAPVWDANRNRGTHDDFESVGEFSTALKPVVEDGDFIQFFTPALPARGDDQGAFEHLKHVEDTARQTWSWEFGVIPSTVDSIPGGSWQHTGNAKEMAVFKGCFGALTEGGLTLMRVRSIDRKSGFAKENLSSTMVDVPFSRWSAMRLHPKQGIETRRVGECRKEEESPREAMSKSTQNAGTS